MLILNLQNTHPSPKGLMINIICTYYTNMSIYIYTTFNFQQIMLTVSINNSICYNVIMILYNAVGRINPMQISDWLDGDITVISFSLFQILSRNVDLNLW